MTNTSISLKQNTPEAKSLREWAEKSNLQFKRFRNPSINSEVVQGGLICLNSLTLEKGKVIKPANAALVEKVKLSSEAKKTESHGSQISPLNEKC